MDIEVLKQAYSDRIRTINSNPTKGVSFEQYAATFETASPPKTATELKRLAGGETKKARIAFEILSEAMKPKIESRNKPVWFNELEQGLLQTVMAKLDWLWERYDTEVQQMAQDRSQIAEGKVNLLQSEIVEMDGYIDELQEQLNDAHQKFNTSQAVLEESKQKDIRIEKLLTQLSEKESQLSGMSTKIEAFHDTKHDLLLKNAEIDRLNREVKSASEAHSKLQDSYQQLLKQQGVLEGKIEVLAKDKSSINTAIEFTRSTDELNSFD